MNRLKLFTAPEHYQPEHRSQLHGILKAHWNDRSLEEQRQVYGCRVDQFEIVDSGDAADIYLLPMLWSYYVTNGRVNEALAFADRARQAGKPCVVWAEGDFGVRFSRHDLFVFQLTISRSKRLPHEFALVPFFDDNIKVHRNGEPHFRKKAPKPVVGFCGQAVDSPVQLGVMSLRTASHRLRYLTGRTPYEPPPLVPPSYLRSRILRSFASSPRVDSNFILRKKYWAGVSSSAQRNDPQQKIKLEYIENLDRSDYIVAVRGTGNWSKRFYEALNWGRIPVFIDTDCVLPYDFAVDWKQYCVYVDQSEIQYAAEKVADFHASLSDSKFVELQAACRQLWLDRLSVDGFYRHFHEHFCPPATAQ